MSVNYKKIILKTTLWTLVSLILISTIFMLIMIFAFPRTLGDFCYSLGANNWATNLYVKEYKKSGNLFYCYKSLNIQIKENNSEKIVSLYEDFSRNEKYEEFMLNLKKRNEDLDVSILEKSNILNEEDYLINRYIKALININEERKAFDCALISFKDYKSFTFKNQGVYALHQFVNLEGFNDFDLSYADFDKTLFESMQEYFNSTLQIFNENKEVDKTIEKSYLVSLGFRIMQVGQNIISITNDTTIKTDINQKLTNVNNVIKGIL